MSTSQAPSFLTRVRNSLASFHPMERRLAEFVIDFPGDLASYSATELATLAGVSNATVTRFIKRLGYPLYEDARRHVREERETGSPLFLTSRSPGVVDRFAAHLQRGQENLQRTLVRLNEAEVDTIANALLSARKIWVTGFRSSQSFATYFRWQIFQVKEDIFVVPNAGDTLGQYAASMTPRDVVVVFSLRRRPAGLREVVTQIVSSGAKVLYITDEAVSRHSEVAWHIHCHCASDGPLDDHVAVMGVCHLLASRVLELAGPQERERLTAIESSYKALHEL
jgi:DNA-binding MurR/RpiR family transcriptional regulator